MISLSGAVGCGTAAELSGAEELGSQEAALETGNELEPNGLTFNGLSVNGLSVNGLSVNGLTFNGLSVNGLSVNGLQAPVFQSWFDADPATREPVVRYMVLCAVPSGQSRTYTSPGTGRAYTWQGKLGLAPGWSLGQPATLAEQQIITACLAAHANKFGVHVALSVLGRSATGAAIPYTDSELATYSENEACFFGNAFNDEGLFAANDRTFLQAKESTTRACGLSAKNQSTDCPPLVHVGQCKDSCTLDSTRTFYTQCTYNGVTYLPITTRILPTDVYTCGDGVCQFTESCGNGNSYDSCKADCGACP
ncbi:MAG: hypothetical protein ACJ8AT_04545 [Hyalangium sp.]|uniref:hypothetical protein n=1 Tax=Hyalangium sp. TaxID=2028555 RepID=UPI00389AB444